MNFAKRQDEYLAEIQQEMRDNVDMNADGSTHFSIDSFRKLSKFESFIREVMRTKGDTIAAVRYTTNDVQVGKYIVSKGSICAPLFYRYDVKLEDGGYSTPDLMNTTRVSPEAIVLVSRRAD
ncbi:hypothetical protein DL95DRAFT_458481 [Leptodontidium sp. 2 PMI_412]|nr:hypothetical protein DL95DRAFT_458481 [Leptodontidium sp. 2 PMI_412]